MPSDDGTNHWTLTLTLTSVVRTIPTTELKVQATGVTAGPLSGSSPYPIWPCELRHHTTRTQLHQHLSANWTAVEGGMRACTGGSWSQSVHHEGIAICSEYRIPVDLPCCHSRGLSLENDQLTRNRFSRKTMTVSSRHTNSLRSHHRRRQYPSIPAHCPTM